jgi:hypothetical protein
VPKYFIRAKTSINRIITRGVMQKTTSPKICTSRETQWGRLGRGRLALSSFLPSSFLFQYFGEKILTQKRYMVLLQY